MLALTNHVVGRYIFDLTVLEKLRNNGKTLRMHTKKQLKKYWGTKRKGKNHGSARSRGS